LAQVTFIGHQVGTIFQSITIRKINEIKQTQITIATFCVQL